MKIRTVHDMILIGLLALGLVGGFLYFQGPTEAYAATLLTNGDMETGAGEPTSWTEWNSNSGTGSRDTTTFRSVTASTKETVSTTASSGTFYYQYFSALPGEVYVASVYIMSKDADTERLLGGAEAFLKMEFKDSSATPGTTISYYESAHLSTHTNGKWQRHTVVGIAPPKTAYVQMNLVTWTDVASASGSAYFDDADLHKVNASTFPTLFTESSSLINESFETGSGTPNGWIGGKTGNLDESYALNTDYNFSRSGANSLMMDAGASASAYALMYESVPVQWGQVVEFTAYVYIPTALPLHANTKAYLKLEWYKWDDTWANPAGETDRSQVEYSTKKSGATAGWEQLSVIGVAPPISSGGVSTDQTFWARPILIVMNDDGIGTDNRYVYFDDVEVKVSGGFGQKTVATTPSVVASTSPGLQLTFDEGWGGNISSYYDYNTTGGGINHMIADDENVHALFDILYQEGGSSSWPSPNKNPYGRLSVIEQSPTRTVIQAYAKALDSLKVPGTGTGVDYWTVTYTVYPDGRMFITESVKIGSASDINDGPFWGVAEDYSLGNVAAFVDDDNDRAGAIQPAAGGHDAAFWVYETGVSDWDITAGFPVYSTSDSADDRIFIQLEGVATTADPGPFTAGSTKTHHWMMDLSDTDFIQADLDSKGLDYKTHTSGSDITFTSGMGTLVTGINSDTYAVDGYDEGAGCWNILTGSGGNLQFILKAGDQVVTRYKPTFFITGYNYTNLPASVEVDDLSTAADDSSVVKELGTDYNIAFVPFSKVYKRYNAHQSFSTIYAEGFNNKTATIAVTTPDNPVDADKTDDYASWKVNTDVLAAAGVLDMWGFNLGSKRDIDDATVNVTYYAAASGTADTVNYYGFVSDFNLDGTFGGSGESILSSSTTAGTVDSNATASLAIPAANLTDDLLRKLEVRAYTDLVTSNTMPAYQAIGTAVEGTGAVTPTWPTHAIGDIALLFIESCGGEAANLTTASGFAAVTNSPQYTGTGTTGTRLTVYWCRATSTSMSPPVVGDPGNHVYAVILTFRGCVATGNPWDVTDGGVKATASTTTTFGTVTTTADNCLIILAGTHDDDTSIAAWSAWTNTNLSSLTERQDGRTAQGNDGGIGVAAGGKAAAGSTGTSTVTITSSTDAHMTIALKPPYNDKTCYLKNAYLSGFYFADDITERMATFDRGSTDYPAIAVFENLDDYLYVGSAYKFSGILVDMYSAGTVSGAVVSITPTFQYYDSGTGWTSLSVTDNTSGFQKDAMITFTAPGNWTTHNKHDADRYIGGKLYTDGIGVEEKLYYVRIARTRTTMDTVPYLRGLATNNLIFQYLRNYLGNPADVTTNTEFALSAPAATLIDLVDFNAIGYFGKVKLFWQTESELDNVGFNILRSEDGKNYVKINTELIKSIGTPIKGAEYTYEEIDVVNGKIYYYLLEDIDRSGAITKHGPVTAHPGRDLDKDGMTDDWEYRYGLPATVADANVDSDDDGLTNIEEFLAGTDPLVIDSQNVVGTSEANGVRVIESAALRTVLELDTSTLKVTNKNEGGIIYQLITLPEYTHGQTTDVGKPQIPTKGILLGTLSKKPVTINILESEKETYPGYNIYPVPKTAFTEDPNDPAIKRLTYEFYKDTNAYSIDAFYPGRLAEADYSNYLQDQQVIKVIFYPIQFNPVKGTLEFYKKIKLEVLQEGADLTTTASAVTPKAALPLTAENAYKIYINESGIYRLTKAYLESQGISLSDLDPRKLKIYEQGAEIPIYVFGEEDGQFSASDYIEFYGQAVDTRYTGTNVYWLALSDEPGLRMADSGQVEDATTTPGSFLETHRGEDSTLYWMEAVGEDHWFIDSVYGSQIYNLTLNLDGVANTTDEATVKIALEGSVYSGEAFMHHLYARLNGYPIADVSWQGAEEYIINSKTSQSHLNEGANTVTLEVGEDPTGYEEILVNWVEVSYLRNFIAKENVLAFGNYTGGAYKYKISGFTNQDIEIYDITDPRGVQRITQFTVLPEGATFAASFKDIGSKEYVVLTPDKAKIPSGVLRDEPSNLADKKNRADYIIITHPDFYETILPFAEYRSAQGLKVKVVKLDDIYDEFNYGIADVNAVKDFLKYAYNNWTGGKPNYVLLVGDATYDYRDFSGYGFTNYVPTYLVKSLTFGETGSDNWFVCFDGDSDLIPDMLIGRFPVKTTDELKSMIDKVITYETVSPDEAWTKKMLLVADDGEKIFTETSENLASYLTKGYTADKQYLGTTTNNPAALKQGIINSINEGRLFVNYTGHGGIGLWANERLFTWDDINSLYNRHTLPIFTTLTCADGYFIYPRYIESLGERLINDANGGAIATFVPSGISYPTTQAYLAQGFYGAYFIDKDAILGSMVAKGKLNVYENESGDDAINVIQTFNLFGDPALRVRMKAPQIPAVAAPEVFNLDKGKVNDIFRLTTEEPKAAESAESTETGTVIVDKVKDTKRGLTKIIHAEEALTALLPAAKESLEDKVPAEKVLSTEGTQLEDKTVALAPPKWRVLSKADPGAKPLAKIDYGAVEKNVTRIKEEAGQLAELKTEFDEAIKAADLQKATSILRVIAKLARKIYWRTF